MIEINEEINILKIDDLKIGDYLLNETFGLIKITNIDLINDKIEFDVLNSLIYYTINSSYLRINIFLEESLLLSNDFKAHFSNAAVLQKLIGNELDDSNIKLSNYISNVKLLKNKNIIDDFKKILDIHFSNEDYDIISENDVIKILIKYNDITIENSLGNSHYIKSLFVKLSYNTSTKKLDNKIEGYRGELSVKELCNNYLHSHLSTHNRNFGTFCLGSSEIGILLSDLSKEFNFDKFDLFLYSLHEYVKWESLEGGPYTKIENLSYRDSSNVIEEAPKHVVEQIIRNINTYENSLNTFDFEFNFQKNKIEIVNNDKLIKLITKYTPSTFMCIIDENGRALKISSKNQLIENAISKLSNYDKFSFKNEKYPKMYEEEFLNNLDENNLKPHPKLISDIVGQLENNVNTYFLNNLTNEI